MHSSKDRSENAIAAGRSLLENVKNCLVYAEENNKLLVIKDLDNYIIVDTKDALLICPRDDSQFRQLFNDIAQKQEKFV